LIRETRENKGLKAIPLSGKMGFYTGKFPRGNWGK
jgi:hypothetical protein